MQWQLNGGIASIAIEVQDFRVAQIRNEPAMIGGVVFTPDILLADTPGGCFLYHQICVAHRLKIITAAGQYELPLDNFPYRDSPGNAAAHLLVYFPHNNLIQTAGRNLGKVTFHDYPKLHLAESFRQINFFISFETWLQFGLTFVPQIPMLRFRWWLQGVASKESGDWRIVQASSSGQAEIRASVQLFSAGSAVLDVMTSPWLKGAVNDYYEANAELRWLLDK